MHAQLQTVVSELQIQADENRRLQDLISASEEAKRSVEQQLVARTRSPRRMYTDVHVVEQLQLQADENLRLQSMVSASDEAKRQLEHELATATGELRNSSSLLTAAEAVQVSMSEQQRALTEENRSLRDQLAPAHGTEERRTSPRAEGPVRQADAGRASLREQLRGLMATSQRESRENVRLRGQLASAEERTEVLLCELDAARSDARAKSALVAEMRALQAPATQQTAALVAERDDLRAQLSHLHQRRQSTEYIRVPTAGDDPPGEEVQYLRDQLAALAHEKEAAQQELREVQRVLTEKC